MSIQVEGVTDFLEQVKHITERQNWFRDDRQWGPWFRGHEQAAWPLKPKLYRDRSFKEVRANDVEDEIREEFVKRAPILCDRLPVGSEERAEWEWYFMMQHFGAATRLLDWTEGALIALYFAARNNTGQHDAAVWMLDPYELNRRAIGKEWVIPPSATGVSKKDKALVSQWLPDRFRKMRGLPKEPVAIEPTHVTRRISSQHSCFTIHGSQELAFEDLSRRKGSCLVKITIRCSGIEQIRRDLRLFGITEATIFPDLDGLGRSIDARWKIDGCVQKSE